MLYILRVLLLGLLAGLALASVAQVTVKSITTDRITYAPGAKGTVTVRLENIDDTPTAGTLVVKLYEGLDSATTLFNGPFTAQPSGRTEKVLPMEVGTAPWGRGIVAEFTAGKETAVGAHAFSVVTNPFMCAIWGRGLPQFGSDLWTDTERIPNCEEIAVGNIANYCNAYEAFAWAPCDYSVMHIDHDGPFYSGQTQYTKNRTAMIALHDVFHKYGIACISYGKTCAAGEPGVVYALKHPEQMHVFSPAGFAHEDISVDVMDRMAEGRFRRHGVNEDFWQRWISCWTQIGNKEAIDFGTDEIMRSAKQFNWDGVRYDGHFSYWDNPEMAARVVKYAADRIHKEFPKFGIGYNYFGPQHDTPEGASTDPELAAAATSGGLMMSEVFRNYREKVGQNILHLQSVGDAVRAHGGYFLAINDINGPWNAALVLAGGARPMGGSNRAYNKFATRYSAFIFDPALRRLQNPRKVVNAVGKPEFLWDSFVYERKVSETRTQLIFQFVNVGTEFNFNGGEKEPPTGVNDPLEHLSFKLTLPAGYKAERVTVVDDRETFIPQAAALNGDTFTVPALAYWTMAVVDLNVKAPAKPLAELCAVPLKDDKTPVTPEALKAILAKGNPDNAAPKMEMLVKPLSFADHKDGLDRKEFAGADRPLTLWRNGRPDIHYACGIMYRWNRPWEALMRVKGARVSTSSLDNGRGACSATLTAKNGACVSNFPSRNELGAMDVLVIDNIPAAGFTQAQRHNVLEFVKSGGSLLVIGDWHGLSKGCWEGSFLEEALPVKVKQATYLLRLQGADQKIAATPLYQQMLKKAAPDFGAGPSIDWTSHVQPNAGAQVLLKAGGQPFLTVGTVGAGRVAVIAGAHAGQPAAPYWQSDAWPMMVGDVLNWLTEPAAQVVQPGTEMTAVHATLDAAAARGRYPAPDDVSAMLRGLLASRKESEALYVANFLLEHPEAMFSEEIRVITMQLMPFIKKTAAWEEIGRQYMYEPDLEDMDAPETTPDIMLGKEGVKGEKLLAALITAIAVPDSSAQQFIEWEGLDTQTRLWCIGLCADTEAIPYLEKVNKELAKQEQIWEFGAPHLRFGMYATRLIRPFVTYALLRCGKRDEKTRYDFCRGAMELPFYAWRQHWILESVDWRNPGSGISSPGMIKRASWQLDYAVQLLPQLFLPEIVGTDEIGLRAVARAIAETDCLKAVPVAQDFLAQIPDKDFVSLKSLVDAKLEPIRGYVKMRLAK